MNEQLGIPPSNFNGGNLLVVYQYCYHQNGKNNNSQKYSIVAQCKHTKYQMHESRSSKLLHVVIGFKAWQLDNN